MLASRFWSVRLRRAWAGKRTGGPRRRLDVPRSTMAGSGGGQLGSAAPRLAVHLSRSETDRSGRRTARRCRYSYGSCCDALIQFCRRRPPKGRFGKVRLAHKRARGSRRPWADYASAETISALRSMELISAISRGRGAVRRLERRSPTMRAAMKKAAAAWAAADHRSAPPHLIRRIGNDRRHGSAF